MKDRIRDLFKQHGFMYTYRPKTCKKHIIKALRGTFTYFLFYLHAKANASMPLYFVPS